MHDVIIIGGGVIGLSLARELAEQGIACAILDQGPLGQESSWAGAGILPPGHPDRAETPEARLRAASHVLWPELSAKLRDETGIDNGYRRCGGVELRLDGRPDELDAEVRIWQREGVEVVPLRGAAAAECAPGIAPAVTAAYQLPELGQVRNPRHLKALIAACARRGVDLLPGTPVWEMQRAGDEIVAVETSGGRFSAEQFVVAAGAWSSRLLGPANCGAAVRPLRGQIVLLNAPECPLRQVINVGPRYLVPRGDGRVLVGSTEEVAGFHKTTTAAGLGGLIDFALSVMPSLATASVERTWAGLRPQSADGLPFLGRVPGVKNLFVAAGHFRAGLQLSPVTAVLMTQLLLGRPTPLPLEPYSVERPGRDFPVPDSL